MTESVAIIDMGTNTFHLLIAEFSKNSSYTIKHRERIAVKMGMGGINEGYITDDGVERALSAMLEFKQIISEKCVKHVYAFGTSALRNAKNADDVIQKITQATNVKPTIISGDLEAEYIYQGVKHSMEIDEPSLIVDIGGGSVECIIGDGTKIFWKESFEIGAQRLLEAFHKSDPITPQEIEALNQHFESTLSSLLAALKKHPVQVLIGASGTFDTLSDIFCLNLHLSKIEHQPETPLSIPGFYEIYEQLTHKTRSERLLIPGMIEMRVDMIVVACCLIHFILSKNQFRTIRVSSYSLKEGVLASLKSDKY